MTSFTSGNWTASDVGHIAKSASADQSFPTVPGHRDLSASRNADPLKSALAYLGATLFCAFFGAVYELFSHEVYSYYMIYAFAIPLALGVLPNLVAALRGLRAPSKRAANAWNSGVAAITVGCLFQGALEIYGTTNQLAIVYPIVAVALLAAGVIFHVRDGLKVSHAENDCPIEVLPAIASERSSKMPSATASECGPEDSPLASNARGPEAPLSIANERAPEFSLAVAGGVS